MSDVLHGSLSTTFASLNQNPQENRKTQSYFSVLSKHCLSTISTLCQHIDKVAYILAVLCSFYAKSIISAGLCYASGLSWTFVDT
jgi:hypothetical protein